MRKKIYCNQLAEHSDKTKNIIHILRPLPDKKEYIARANQAESQKVKISTANTKTGADTAKTID